MTVANAAAWPALIGVAVVLTAGAWCTVAIAVTYWRERGQRLTVAELDGLHRRIDRGQR
jgi:hypothetical protein